jgi:sulfite reductase (NADPH) flavoprotein alpha-component
MDETVSEPVYIPCLPENAPFTPEQRAYLNGFLAGLFSRAPTQGSTPGAQGPSTASQLTSLTVLFGSQTGNSETLAKRIAREAGRRGFAATVHDLGNYTVQQLASERRVLIVTSTYGDGEPPDNARTFWTSLIDNAAPKIPETQFSICALGDSNYPKFCGFGKDVDVRLEALGARRVAPRADCDVDFEEPFARWLDMTLSAMRETDGSSSVSESPRAEPANEPATAMYSRSKPFPAPLLVNQRLNAVGSEKDTRHFEFDLGGSGLEYEPGDALGVLPLNCAELVEEFLSALHFSGAEAVPGHGGNIPIREALLRHYEITRIAPPFLQAMAERTGDELLGKLVASEANGQLKEFLWGREIIDLLLAHPAVTFTPIEFVGLLKKLNPRLYSISSSPKLNPGKVHATVNVVRYESLSRRRKGVCSTFLAERVPPNDPVSVFLHANKNFRLPAQGDTPMIMVGPGTGIAPFRAFLQERFAAGVTGKNWLFYGDQHSATDFMYRDELETYRRSGTLTRLDTAFSRDQTEKVYVQHRMRESAKELFAWLEGGAHVYVCGDAKRMASDVDAALHEIVRDRGGLNSEQAAEYVARLRAEKRYQRDVY